MQKTISRYFFLLLIVWVQFGSTGFIYFENTCEGSNSRSLSLNKKECCCFNIQNSDSDEKVELEFKGKCCNSIERIQKTTNEYPVSFYFFEFIVPGYFGIGFPEIKDVPPFELLGTNYNYIHPPDTICDIRISIQSFQI